MGEATAKITRVSRDRLKGQPQERQHSAAEGGTRDRLPPASDSRATSRRVGINFAFCDIVSMLCMSTHGVRMFTEPVFYRGRHGQESEEGKEDREGSHQEGGKEDFKEKEVVVSATERLPPPGRNPDAKRNLSKGSEASFAAVRYRGKAR